MAAVEEVYPSMAWLWFVLAVLHMGLSALGSLGVAALFQKEPDSSDPDTQPVRVILVTKSTEEPKSEGQTRQNTTDDDAIR